MYEAGFATSLTAYEDAVAALFAALDRMEVRLCRQRYLLGAHITEADWRFFPAEWGVGDWQIPRKQRLR